MQRSCKLVEEVYDVLNLVWKTYHFSAKSARDLKALAGELGINVLKPTQVTGTWWLLHVSRALKVFIKPGESKIPDDTTGQYAVVVYHMDHLSASSNKPTLKATQNTSRKECEISSLWRSVTFWQICSPFWAGSVWRCRVTLSSFPQPFLSSMKQ